MRGSVRLGFWSAITTASAAAISLGLGVATPARSGSNCTVDCIGAPYTAVAQFVPRDYLWMYPAIATVSAFVVLIACLHVAAGPSRRASSLTALCFAVASATIAVVAYSVQLTVVQPLLVQGQLDGLSLWSMYNPNGLFISLENGTYLLLGVCFLFLAAALPPARGLVRIARVILTLAGGVTLLSLVVLGIVYGIDVGYRFEVVAISATWVALIPVGALLALAFRRGLLPNTDVSVELVDHRA